MKTTRSPTTLPGRLNIQMKAIEAVVKASTELAISSHQVNIKHNSRVIWRLSVG